MRAVKGAWAGAKRVPRETVVLGAAGVICLAMASMAWLILPLTGAILAVAEEEKKKDFFLRGKGMAKASVLASENYLEAMEKEIDRIRAEPEPEPAKPNEAPQPAVG